MKKLIASAIQVAELKEYEEMPLLDNEVKVKVRYASPKHGTEVVDFRGLSPFIDENYNPEWQMFMERDKEEARGIVFGDFALGNMFVGEIVEVGKDVVDYKINDIVCSYGCICDYINVNAIDNYKLRKLKDYKLWKNAVCYDPAQFALSGVRDAQVRAGDYVVVIGLGAIGQIAIQLAKKAGASIVIGVEPIKVRQEIALEYGADFVLDPFTQDVGYEIKKLTNKKGADSIIETSGVQDALQASLKGLAYGGIISYVAFAKEFKGGFNLGREAHFNNAKIVFSRAASEPNPDYPRWDRKRIEDTCWQLLMENYIDCSKIISPVVNFKDVAQSYMEFVDQKPELSIKMGIDYEMGDL